MISVKPLIIENHPFTAIRVEIPKTNLLIISNEVGYIMCGALDVDLLSDKLADRKIVAARATGVKTIEQLLEAPLDKVTTEAKNRGWSEGMNAREALLKIAE
ncbi:YunC family protein [Aquibacillus albus]|uniref:Uncharacterized protein YunC (DUF1805 family) n=1 Tax=Aquibacillus albus TaxID=1168171 RepID=A0ABS2MYR2_9BACI|nr:DUF1805 domain-containing protein [Aquibacillus albus]MBM7570974.1 uncharacterized protein YunC (DUF1805 family) [Aquibacillus albus]